ncbi:MAG: aspartyl protease family protein [Bacteroidia bacterium]
MSVSTIPFKILSIGDDGYHLLVKMHVNRKVAKMIVDTGASTTVFDLKRSAKYVSSNTFKEHTNLSSGLGTNSMKSQFTNFKKITIGNILIENYQAILLDLTHVNDSYNQVGLPEIDGVLGSDILLKHHAVIDYKKKTLKLQQVKKKKV